jgi:hypothetical protein
VSPATEKIVMRGLNMEPEARFKNADDMLEALRKISLRRPGSHTSETAGTVPIESPGISTALIKLGFSQKIFSAELLLRLNIVLLVCILLLLILLLAKN